MIIQDIVKNLYINRKSDWIKDVEDSDIPSFVIQLWLVGNDHIRTQVRWLDKYVFVLPPKMYLSLAWSIIPKSKIVPYRTDLLKIDEENDPYLSKENNKYDFLTKKVRKQFKLGDNDYNSLKPRLIAAIEKNLAEWFIYYGAERKHWKQFNLNFNLMKRKETQGQTKLLSAFI